jgi:D-amino-acid dehydrogenase
MADAMLRAAVRLGATYMPDLARPVINRGRATGIEVGSNIHAADAVVLATGVWPVGEDTKPPGGAVLQRGQILHLRLPGLQTGSWPVVLPLNGYYLLTFDDSRIVVGATREEGTGFDLRITAAGVAEVLAAGLTAAPGLANATIIETRVGLRPMAPVRRPVLGEAPDVERLFIGNGLGASGLTMGPYAGSLLANLVLGNATPIPLAPYAPVA